jgi:hypothetical protein
MGAAGFGQPQVQPKRNPSRSPGRSAPAQSAGSQINSNTAPTTRVNVIKEG